MKLLSMFEPARETATVNGLNSRTGLEARPRQAGERVAISVGLTLIAMVLCAGCVAQSVLPFDVSNPKHQKLPVDEAGRIYLSACMLAARTIRPERPPHLQPKFTLVLGAADDEMVREEGTAKIHLKAWNPANFAQAVVMLAMRDILRNEDVQDIVRTAVLAAQASVSVRDMRQGH